MTGCCNRELLFPQRGALPILASADHIARNSEALGPFSAIRFFGLSRHPFFEFAECRDRRQECGLPRRGQFMWSAAAVSFKCPRFHHLPRRRFGSERMTNNLRSYHHPPCPIDPKRRRTSTIYISNLSIRWRRTPYLCVTLVRHKQKSSASDGGNRALNLVAGLGFEPRIPPRRDYEPPGKRKRPNSQSGELSLIRIGCGAWI